MKKIFVCIGFILVLTSCRSPQTKTFTLKPFTSTAEVETEEMKIEFEVNYNSENDITVKILKPDNINDLKYIKQNDLLLMSKGNMQIELNKTQIRQDVINSFFKVISDFSQKEIVLNNSVYISKEPLNYSVSFDEEINKIKSLEYNDYKFVFKN